jgi:hypothetical protein
LAYIFFVLLVNPKVTLSSGSVFSAEIDRELALFAQHCEKSYSFRLALMQELLKRSTPLA